ncbi:Transcription factor [Penicillium capsulatum]|uniref:Transcription factor n=1 Tax=Penicillium capsulatum TaxID=69766 RepID=A0A9W9I0X5_9EURO|nr:Transcription factor [Penicillium capsulatum]KAJ6108762.1 Transcription factor [Penicillium capsulatum]
MLPTVPKRKRAKKACIPCHQRKRKCDAEYPCGTCITYEYDCKYADDEAGGHAPPPTRRVLPPSPDSPDNWMHGAKETRGAAGPSTKSPTVVAATSPGIFDEQKSRYAGASAAMAFPHILSMALGSENTSKMHSFAYNFGIRPEEASNPHGLLGQLISEEDLGYYSGVYFTAMGSYGDYMDPVIYAQRCRNYYHHFDNSLVAFGAVAAGVAALGSFLCPDKHPRETDLVRYAKDILDDPASMRMLSIDQIIAWGMRVFYLRATTRPNNAWIASCTLMHLLEAIGLHREENINKMASIAGVAATGQDADRLRRIFWLSWTGHHLLCYEFDRSSVHFDVVTCLAVMPMAGSIADQFVHIGQIIPAPNSPFRLDSQPSTPRDELIERLKAINKLPYTHPFLVVTIADVSLCFYRRIYQLNAGITDEVVKLVIQSGNAAVEAAEQLASQGLMFWNAIGSVFQYACALLAIDTPAASPHIATAFRGLENLVKAGDTELTRRALSMARYLLSLSMEKKRRELAQLEAVEASYQFQTQPEPEANATLPDIGWAEGWDQFFFEPYLSMFGPDLHFQE